MRAIKTFLINFAVDHPKWIIIGLLSIMAFLGAFFPNMAMDTDPENLLEQNAPVRVFHNATKKQFDLSETIVVGVIREDHPNGVFNPQTLKHVFELTQFAKTLRYASSEHPGKTSGVIEVDMVAPSMVDHMSQAGPGTISFEWLMPRPPANEAEALAVRDRAMSNPLLVGQMVSKDGKALCLYLPLTDKLLSYDVYTALRNKIKEFSGTEEYHIAGLPVAEGAIGVEMFSEMVLASPLTMALIFGLLYVMFRKWILIALPMLIATIVSIATLGSMIALGFPVHILSSMLPIFLMSISICDSIHVLSEFFDVYTAEKGRKESIKEVMHTLFMPMLYTSLTTAAGFFSLLTLDIPPARVFGAFVGVGILFAWVTTILLIPAYIMLIPERMLRNFGKSSQESERALWLTRLLRRTGEFVIRRAKLVLALLIACIAFSVWGMSQITINDNYAKRFAEGHPIREADTVLNKHLGGTYTVSLVLKGEKGGVPTQADVARIAKALAVQAEAMDDLRGQTETQIVKLVEQLQVDAVSASSVDDLLAKAVESLDVQIESASPDDQIVLEVLRSSLEMEIEKNKPFKRPDVLNYMANLQASLIRDGFIGKSTSLADIVCKVHQELIDGRPENFRIPQSVEAVSECVMQYQQGHKPNDIWHFVTPDFETANMFMQFTSGDSMRTEAAVEAIRTYFETNKPPVALSYDFAGLHYVNMIFQGKMFWGMLTSLAGSFVIVLLMMIVLFRSVSWGLLCMVPLSVTIMFIYGSLGFLGLDYDMPVAVLGAISLGIAVDFAIHFLERSRQITSKTGSWSKTAPIMFGKPARAISRNVIVIAFGFLPMLIAALVPYKTTGLLLFSILIFSGIATLLVLPAFLTVAQGWFFKPSPGLDQSDTPTTPDTSVPVMARVDESAK